MLLVEAIVALESAPIFRGLDAAIVASAGLRSKAMRVYARYEFGRNTGESL